MKDNNHISIELLDSFLKGDLPSDRSEEIELHLSGCKECSERFDNLRSFSPVLKGWTARSHGEAYEQIDEEKQSHVREYVTKIVNDLKNKDFESMTDLDRKRMGNWDLEYSRKKRIQDVDKGRKIIRRAAAPKSEPSIGESLGVSVIYESEEKSVVKVRDEDSIVTVSASVSSTLDTDGTLSIIGIQDELGITKALDFLHDKILNRFESLALSALKLKQREIKVEIEFKTEEESVKVNALYKASSLALAVIIAIVKGATGRTGCEGIVYSADIDMSGKLKGVGRVVDKVESVLSNPHYRLIISSEDYWKIPDTSPDRYDGRLSHFSSLEAVLEDHDLLVGREISAVSDREPEARKHSFLNPLRAVALFGILGVLTALIFFILSAGNFFAVADLMIAWHLGHEGSQIFRYAQVIKYFLITILAVWLPIIIKVKKFRRLKMEQFFILIILVFFTSNFYVFIRDFYVLPGKYEKYERVEYLKYNESLNTLFGFLRDTPNYRYIRFKKLSASPNKSDIGEALKVGDKIKPVDPLFKEGFIELAKILMGPINDTDSARKLLFNYFDYTDFIQNRKDTRGYIADTIDSARDLMGEYHLKDAFYKTVRLGSRIEELLIQYNLK